MIDAFATTRTAAATTTSVMKYVARRVLGETHTRTLKMRCLYAVALYREAGATFDDLREAVAMLEETARNIRRVLGGTHPTTLDIERDLQDARAALYARGLP